MAPDMEYEVPNLLLLDASMGQKSKYLFCYFQRNLILLTPDIVAAWL